VRALRRRQGGTAGIYPLFVLTLLQMAIQFSFFGFSGVFKEGERLYQAASSVAFPPFGFALGLVIVLPFLLFRWKELYRWLPTPTEPLPDKLEKALLLYTPLQRRKLVYHMLFHACLILGTLLIIFALYDKTTDLVYCGILPFLGMMALIRWLAWRSEKKSTMVPAGEPG
jgi:hypothetical protein